MLSSGERLFHVYPVELQRRTGFWPAGCVCTRDARINARMWVLYKACACQDVLTPSDRYYVKYVKQSVFEISVISWNIGSIFLRPNPKSPYPRRVIRCLFDIGGRYHTHDHSIQDGELQRNGPGCRCRLRRTVHSAANSISSASAHGDAAQQLEGHAAEQHFRWPDRCTDGIPSHNPRPGLHVAGVDTSK